MHQRIEIPYKEKVILPYLKKKLGTDFYDEKQNKYICKNYVLTDNEARDDDGIDKLFHYHYRKGGERTDG